MKLIITAIAASLVLIGCGGWTHPTNTDAQFRQDSYQCDQDALSMYPVRMEGPTYISPATTECRTYGNQTSCTTQPAVTRSGYQTDANLINRINTKNNCLRARGYVFSTSTIDSSGSTSSPAVPQMEVSTLTLSQKEKWVTVMATKNGCSGTIKVNFKNKNGIREVFEAICENKTLEFTCEFIGPVSEGLGGIPFVAVTGKSYQVQPACWR